MQERQFEERGARFLWWALWLGIAAATAGEIVLFVYMDPSGGHGTEAVGHLPASQLVVVASVSAVMVALAAAIGTFEIGGGGFPTALMVWALLKGVGVAGLVVYQLADNHLYYWPFVAVFGVGMLASHPGRFHREEST